MFELLVCSTSVNSVQELLEVMYATWGDLTMHRGHLVVKHDSLGEILLQATEVSEARQVIFFA